MTRLTTSPPPIAAAAIVPSSAGSGPLTPAQLRCVRVRITLQELTALVEGLEACDVSVRQAACQALAAVVELQAALQAQRPTEPQEQSHGPGG